MARQYGKVIISEVHVPHQHKTIKPTMIGGVAGGTKYIVKNILFKVSEYTVCVSVYVCCASIQVHTQRLSLSLSFSF